MCSFASSTQLQGFLKLINIQIQYFREQKLISSMPAKRYFSRSSFSIQKQFSQFQPLILFINFGLHNNFIKQSSMNRGRPYINRFVKQKQLQISDVYHDIKMKDIKPITTKLMEHTDNYVINNSKREMSKQIRDLEIERENKMLLGKIESVMSKKGNYSVAKTKSINTKTNKSLNEIFRKKQLEFIELQNKRFLARLQSKKPTLNNVRLMHDWNDNKEVIKRMTNCEFNLAHFKSKTSRIRSFTSSKLYRSKYETMRLNKIKVIDGKRMLIKIEFSDGFLKIVGDCKDYKDLKVIEIPYEEAVTFIEKDCEGKLQVLLQKLRYDQNTGTLYVMSESGQSELEPNPQRPQTEVKNRKQIKSLQLNATIDCVKQTHDAQPAQFQTLDNTNYRQQQKQQNKSSSASLKSKQRQSQQQNEIQNKEEQKYSLNFVSKEPSEKNEPTIPKNKPQIQIQNQSLENYNEQFQQSSPKIDNL